MWTILAFLGGFSTCLTIFVVGAVIGGGRDDDDTFGPDEAELQVSLSEHVRELNEARH